MEPPVQAAVPNPRAARRVTIEEWLAIPEEKRAELIAGVIVYQGMPGPKHGEAQGMTFALVGVPFGRRPAGSSRPGGWWISQEVDMELGEMGCRPDILGWRRDRQPTLPEPDARGLVTAVPDWICEVLSRSTASIDQGKKRRAYHRAGVAHYWLLDPGNRTLTVLERVDRDYLVVLAAGVDEVVCAPPFDAVEMAVAEMFGDEGDAQSLAVLPGGVSEGTAG